MFKGIDSEKNYTNVLMQRTYVGECGPNRSAKLMADASDLALNII